MGASFKSSKPPVKFPKVNQTVMLAEMGIYDCVPRQADPLNAGKLKQKGGKDSIMQSGGWKHSHKTGVLRHERVQVCKQKAPDMFVCGVTGINPKTGKKHKKQVIVGNRSTYPVEIKDRIEKEEAEYNLAKKDKEPRKYTARKHLTKPKRALGRR